MILPKRNIEFWFYPFAVKYAYLIRGDDIGRNNADYVIVLQKNWWRQLPEILKWFVTLHEMFHVVQLRTDSIIKKDPKAGHFTYPCEWEADWYASRMLLKAGIDLRMFSEKLRKYIGRDLYIPFIFSRRLS